MLDWFVAPLRCPACGADSPNAGVQTHIRNVSADGSALRIGFELDAVDLTSDSILGYCYLIVQEPDIGGPIRLLDVWSCSSCHTDQWAMIEIVDRRVGAITAVILDRSTLRAAHFISDYADLLADSLRGGGDGDLDTIAVLKLRLP